jgi:hypothetical protein
MGSHMRASGPYETSTKKPDHGVTSSIEKTVEKSSHKKINLGIDPNRFRPEIPKCRVSINIEVLKNLT